MAVTFLSGSIPGDQECIDVTATADVLLEDVENLFLFLSTTEDRVDIRRNITTVSIINRGSELTIPLCHMTLLWPSHIMRSEIPYCAYFLAVVDCGPLPNIPNGTVNFPGGTLAGDVVIYICDDGFKLIGQVFRTCLQNGSWSGEEPRCERKSVKRKKNLCATLTLKPSIKL